MWFKLERLHCSLRRLLLYELKLHEYENEVQTRAAYATNAAHAVYHGVGACC